MWKIKRTNRWFDYKNCCQGGVDLDGNEITAETPTVLGFFWHLTKWVAFIVIQHPIALLICRVKGHKPGKGNMDCECERCGNPLD